MRWYQCRRRHHHHHHHHHHHPLAAIEQLTKTLLQAVLSQAIYGLSVPSTACYFCHIVVSECTSGTLLVVCQVSLSHGGIVVRVFCIPAELVAQEVQLALDDNEDSVILNI